MAFISGHSRTTGEIIAEFSGTSSPHLMRDKRLLRESGDIIRVAPATYQVRAEAEVSEEHPFVRNTFNDADSSKLGERKRRRQAKVRERHRAGMRVRDIAAELGCTTKTIHQDIREIAAGAP